MGIMIERIKKLLRIKSKKKQNETSKKRLIESSSLYETRVLTEEEMMELARERENYRSTNSWEEF